MLQNVSDVDNIINDILVFTDTFDQHVFVLSKVLQRLRSAKLTTRPTKWSLAYPNPDKVLAIQQSNLSTANNLLSFLGLVNFYSKFIPKFAYIALSSTDITRKFPLSKLQWT